MTNFIFEIRIRKDHWMMRLKQSKRALKIMRYFQNLNNLVEMAPVANIFLCLDQVFLGITISFLNIISGYNHKRYMLSFRIFSFWKWSSTFSLDWTHLSTQKSRIPKFGCVKEEERTASENFKQNNRYIKAYNKS